MEVGLPSFQAALQAELLHKLHGIKELVNECYATTINSQLYGTKPMRHL
jgi:hypothetical protein